MSTLNYRIMSLLFFILYTAEKIRFDNKSADVKLVVKLHDNIFETIKKMPVAVYDGCDSVEFVYWLRLKQYL